MGVDGFKLSLFFIFFIITASLNVFAQVPTNVYLNDSATYKGGPNNVSLIFNASGTRVNFLNLSQNLVHSFEGQAQADGSHSNYKYIVEYNSSNSSGYVLKLRINDEAQASFNDKIEKFDCNANTFSPICDNNCGGFDFLNPTNFTVKFFFDLGIFNITLSGGSTTNTIAGGQLCSNASIGNIIFAPYSSGGDRFTIDNNVVIADNRVPSFIGNFSNISFPEDTNFSLNLSGNFSDLDAQNLTFGYSDLENISVIINQSSGIANLIPPLNFNGIRYAKFFANDSQNITYSNNVTINVTPVNDAPNISNVMLNNTDFLNRTNGSLVIGWTFSDIDGDTQNGSETWWYINGTEKIEFRNFTIINPTNTTKNQNWSVSVKVFDGTNWSEFVNGSNLIILNSLQFFNPSLGVVQAERNELFVYDVNYTDLDSDNMNFYDNSSFFNITNEGIINFTPQNIGNISVDITIENDSNISGTLIIEVLDTKAPKVTSIITSNSGSTTITVTLSAATDENATCAFAISDLNFTSMTNMSSTSSTSHSNSISYSSDTSGRYYARCLDNYGNTMNFSNSTAFNADVQETSSSSSSSSSSGGGGGGGAGSGYVCSLNWKCDEWSSCENEEQTRKCVLVGVPVFTLNQKCPQDTIPEQSRSCAVPEVKKETCSDGTKNQDEEDIDCGGVCEPCKKPIIKNNATQNQNLITGAVVGTNLGFSWNNLWIVLAIILALFAVFLYGKYSHKRLFRKEKLSEEEMKKLNETLSSRMFKK